MASEKAIDEAMDRVCHRWGKGAKWADAEREEWRKNARILNATDEQFTQAVSAFVAGKETYHLDGLLAKMGRGPIKVVGEGCLICTSGMIELAVWKGDDVSAFNPAIWCIKCACNGGKRVRDSVIAMKESDRYITDIYYAAEVVDGQPQRRALTSEETGEAQRTRMRIAGVLLPGSVAAMDEAIAGMGGGEKPKHKHTPPARKPSISEALEQLRNN